MMFESFKLEHVEGVLYAIVELDGKEYRKDVTQCFEEDNAHDNWLDYRLSLKYPDYPYTPIKDK